MHDKNQQISIRHEYTISLNDGLCSKFAEDIEKRRNKNNSGGMNNLAMFLRSHEGRVCTSLLQHNDQ